MSSELTCAICNDVFRRKCPADTKCKSCKSSPNPPELSVDQTSESSEIHVDEFIIGESKIDSIKKVVDLIYAKMHKMEEEIVSLKAFIAD